MGITCASAAVAKLARRVLRIRRESPERQLQATFRVSLSYKTLYYIFILLVNHLSVELPKFC